MPTVIQRQLADGAVRKLVGLKPDGKAPAREGTEIQAAGRRAIGRSPAAASARPRRAGGHGLRRNRRCRARHRSWPCFVRGKPLPARVAALPFVPHRYHR